MEYSEFFRNTIPDAAKLLQYGFVRDGDAFVLERDLKQNGLYAVIRLAADQKADVEVLDRAFGDTFLPFTIKASQCPEKQEVANLLDEIVKACCDRVEIKAELLRYLFETYGTQVEYPWKAYPNYCTCKTANSKKWYAIFMDIKPSCIGLKGERMLDVMNVKFACEKIPLLVDHVRYFPAYHMSKKNWITVLLDRNASIEEIKALIDESYALTERHA